MTQEELQAIKERLKGIDSGFWFADSEKWPGNDNLQYWVSSTDLDGDGLCACVDKREAEFIAHARQDVPNLLAEVERLQVENKKYRIAIDLAEGQASAALELGYEKLDLEIIQDVLREVLKEHREKVRESLK